MRKILFAIGFLAVLMTGPGSPAPDPAWPPFAGAPSIGTARAESSGEAQAEGTGERPLAEERRAARSRFRYMAIGYGLFWVALGFYLFRLHARVAAVGREIEELKGRLAAARDRPAR